MYNLLLVCTLIFGTTTPSNGECFIPNIEFSQSQQQNWEYIGEIAIYWMGDYQTGPSGQMPKLYVRVIGNRLFYKVVFSGNEYTVVPNPDYGNKNDWKGKYKYMAGPYYLNLPY